MGIRNEVGECLGLSPDDEAATPPKPPAHREAHAGSNRVKPPKMILLAIPGKEA